MKKVLITKLASLGDLIHTLPALSDAAAAIPGVQFDWVVDRNFFEIPLWHPSVRTSIRTNHRVWRSHPFAKTSRNEFFHLLKELRHDSYDLIIDAQGNIKSSILSLAVKGTRAGWNGSSVIEWGSHFLYHKCYATAKNLHAIERLRSLFAQALHYPLPSTPPNYSINETKLLRPNIDVANTYLFFVPIASHDSKLWPETYWKNLIDKSVDQGFSILLPWGNIKEKERASRLAVHPKVQVLPKLSLSEIAFLIQHAIAVVSVDTGLSHIAAALGTPAISLYGPTDPLKTGTLGINQYWIQSPTSDLSQITPSSTFERLMSTLKN